MKQVLGKELKSWVFECPECSSPIIISDDDMIYQDNPSEIECPDCYEVFEGYFGDL